jgi:hypothetical protein
MILSGISGALVVEGAEACLELLMLLDFVGGGNLDLENALPIPFVMLSCRERRVVGVSARANILYAYHTRRAETIVTASIEVRQNSHLEQICPFHCSSSFVMNLRLPRHLGRVVAEARRQTRRHHHLRSRSRLHRPLPGPTYLGRKGRRIESMFAEAISYGD